MNKFKEFVDHYEFEYMVEGEKQLNDLKKELSDLPEFSKNDSLYTEPLFSEYFMNKKFNKLIKQLHNYISKNKKRYFFIDEKMEWVINGIFREYSKLSMDNMGSVRTSWYLDNEYYLAVNHLLDYDEFSKILIFSKINEE